MVLLENNKPIVRGQRFDTTENILNAFADKKEKINLMPNLKARTCYNPFDQRQNM